MIILLLIDYIAYWLYTLLIFAVLQRMFRKIPIKKTFTNKVDVFVIGVASLGLQLYFMTQGEYFIIDDFGWV